MPEARKMLVSCAEYRQSTARFVRRLDDRSPRGLEKAETPNLQRYRDQRLPHIMKA